MKKKLVFLLLLSTVFLVVKSQVNPLGVYYCKMYRYSGTNLVFYCYGSLKIETSPWNANYLTSTDSCCVGYCDKCWQVSFNQLDSTFNNISGCNTCTAGKLYLNDSICYNQKQGTAPAINYYFGHKLYSYPTAIDEVENLNDKVFVYPNPAKDFIYVQSWIEGEIQEIQLQDCTGKDVLVTRIVNAKTTEINLNVLNNGIYFLRVKDKTGMATKKIVVQH
jgi:Secretion system C-terminal sorting domain